MLSGEGPTQLRNRWLRERSLCP